jgi:hypothetical protein
VHLYKYFEQDLFHPLFISINNRGKTIVEIQFTHFESKMFAFLLTETEYNNRIIILQHDHFNNLVNIRGS